MIRQIRVELARMSARRMNRILVLLVLALLVLAGVLTFLNSDASFDRETALAQAEERRRSFIEECSSGSIHTPEGQAPPEGVGRERYCEQLVGSAEDFIVDKRFKYVDVQEILVGVSFQFILAMIVIGASAMGAEWSNRTMTTTLTWEPRRSRVFGAKLVACATFVLTVLLGMMSWLMLMLLPSGLWRGTMAGVDASWWQGTAENILRIGALGALASVLALSIATVTRNTAGSLAVVFGYLAIFESLVRGLKPSWQTWLLGNNISVAMTGSPPGYDPERTVAVAVLIVAVYSAAVIGGAWRFFTRADIG